MHPKINSQKRGRQTDPTHPLQSETEAAWGPKQSDYRFWSCWGLSLCRPAGCPEACQEEVYARTLEEDGKVCGPGCRRGALQSEDAFAPLQVPQSLRATTEQKSPGGQPAKASAPSDGLSVVPLPACNSFPLSMGTVIF